MPNITGYIARLSHYRQKFDGLPVFMENYLRRYEDVVLQLNKDGMLLGRNTNGAEFTPGYLTDPYFKNPAAANAYFRYKTYIRNTNRGRIMFPLNYPEKGADTPDLRRMKRDGGPGENFQDSMYVQVGPSETIIGSTYKDTPAIVAKYDNKVFGLTPEALRYFKYEYPNSRQAMMDYFAN
jgi:hypothetical protein